MTQDEVCASVKYGKSKINYLISSSDPKRSSIFPKPNKKAGRNLWLKSDIDRYKEWVLAALPDVEYDNWIKSGDNANPNSSDTLPKLELKMSSISTARDIEIVGSPISEFDEKRFEIGQKILKKDAEILAVAFSDASLAVPAEELISIAAKASKTNLDVHVEAKEVIVEVSSPKVLEVAVVMPELAPLATVDNQLPSEPDAGKNTFSAPEVSSLLPGQVSEDDGSDTSSVVIANLGNVLEKILPVVNVFYLKHEQRSAYLRDLIEGVAKEKNGSLFEN